MEVKGNVPAQCEGAKGKNYPSPAHLSSINKRQGSNGRMNAEVTGELLYCKGSCMNANKPT